MGTRDVLGAGVAVAVAAMVAIVGMVAVVGTSECRSSPMCDNLGAAWAALTVGAGIFTLVLSGYLIWVLSRRGVREFSAAASVATVTAVVVGGVWGTVWLVELASPIGLLFPIVSVAPLLALPAGDRTLGSR